MTEVGLAKPTGEREELDRVIEEMKDVHAVYMNALEGLRRRQGDLLKRVIERMDREAADQVLKKIEEEKGSGDN